MKTTINIEDLKKFADFRAYEVMQMPDGDERAGRMGEITELLDLINQKLDEE